MKDYATTPSFYDGHWYVYHGNTHGSLKLARDQFEKVGVKISINQIEKQTYKNKNGKYFTKVEQNK